MGLFDPAGRGLERSAPRPPLVAVCGASVPTATEVAAAEAVGRGLAERGIVVLCGGLGGVMAAAARGVAAAGGTTIGLLPGWDPDEAAPEVTFAIPTGMGEGRNLLLVRAARAVVAIGGGYGTLSEIALALRLGRPVVALHTWEIRRPGEARPDPGLRLATTAEEAVAMVAAALAAGGD